MRVLIMRRASASDIPGVLAFWQVAAEDAHRPPDSAEALGRLLERDPEALILAEDDGRLVGSVIAGWDGWRCHLYRLAVSPDRRRQGIGTALLGEAERRLRALGGTRADAMVLGENHVAHDAWRANGYRVQGEWARWVKPLGRDEAGSEEAQGRQAPAVGAAPYPHRRERISPPGRLERP